MRFLYYIVGIVVMFSVFAVYGLKNTQVELSTPALVINDRIITEEELDGMIQSKPYYMTRKAYLDSVVTRQLLIQEAVRQNINKEEAFRRSVENYYEQSLIKILLDRTLKSIEVDVTDKEIEHYHALLDTRVKLTKFGYKTLDQARRGKGGTSQTTEVDFIDLSDDLKFIVYMLDEKQVSQPIKSGMGVMTYRLDAIMPIEDRETGQKNSEDIADFIRDKKREIVMDEWTENLKDRAKIWRTNES